MHLSAMLQLMFGPSQKNPPVLANGRKGKSDRSKGYNLAVWTRYRSATWAAINIVAKDLVIPVRVHLTARADVDAISAAAGDVVLVQSYD